MSTLTAKLQISRFQEYSGKTAARVDVVLQPLTMRIPNRYGIYSPSKLLPKKQISYEEFLLRYADHPQTIRICKSEALSLGTIFENSTLVTAYGSGLDCWYIVEKCGHSNCLLNLQA